MPHNAKYYLNRLRSCNCIICSEIISTKINYILFVCVLFSLPRVDAHQMHPRVHFQFSRHYTWLHVGHQSGRPRRGRSEHVSLEMLKIRVAEQVARLCWHWVVDHGGDLGVLQIALRVLLQLLLSLLLLQQVFQQQRLILQC